MDRQRMSEQIQRELAEYRTLTTDEEKAAFWVRIKTLDAHLGIDELALINEIIYDDLQRTITRTEELLYQAKLTQTTSQAIE